MKHGIRRLPQLWRATRLARRWYHARTGAYPDWRELIAADPARWTSARTAAAGGPRVLLATAIGSYAHAVTLESALAAALTFRGADVHVLLCDGSMTACALANIVICSSILDARDQDAGGKATIFPVDLQGQAEKVWWDGVAWMDYWWTMGSNINHGSYHYYYMYCLERACDLKRINLLAGHPWYNEGALVLVDEQLNADTGAWTKTDTHKPSDILNTCFALLFLNRSTPAITSD